MKATTIPKIPNLGNPKNLHKTCDKKSELHIRIRIHRDLHLLVGSGSGILLGADSDPDPDPRLYNLP
jgi:hypothetical protein